MATTKAASAAKPKPAKAARKALDPMQCRYGQGSYGSPKTMARCKSQRNPKRQLCDEHEKAWRTEAKKRAAARKAEAAKVAPKAEKPKAGKPRTAKSAPRPPRQSIARVPVAEPQPAMVQLVTRDSD